MAEAPLFFLHFPRTAGTTIDDIFFANYPQEKIIKIYSREEYARYKEVYSEDLAGIEYITGHLLLTRTNPPQLYNKDVRVFTFLRDPVKRLFSEYLFLKTWDQQHLYRYLNDNAITFAQYITSIDKPLMYRGKNFMTRCISGDSLEQGNIEASLEKAKRNLVHSFFFFGIQERFTESLLMFSEMAGLKNIFHQKRNSLNYNTIALSITPEEEAIAREYNWADIELYNYALQIFDERVRARGDDFIRKLKAFRILNEKYQKIANLLEPGYSQQNGDVRIQLPK